MALLRSAARAGRSIRVRGVVQGVGFRPFVYRLARQHGLDGWIRNDGAGVQMHVEGADAAIDAFLCALRRDAPPAAELTDIDIAVDGLQGVNGFEIRGSDGTRTPTARIAVDLPICNACRGEMLDPSDRRYGYPYINCTDCGPRYSIVLALPYDRPHTTMAAFAMCAACAAEYHDPDHRRFHAQPIACPACGPTYRLCDSDRSLGEVATSAAAIAAAARQLRDGRIVAVKGIGGYHLACDAAAAGAVAALRERKFRKEQAFAVMVRDLAVAEETVHLTPSARALLLSAARPIVLAPARTMLPGVAPDSGELGLMLPYAPIHYLLFDAGAPSRIVMTSGNRSSEPIAYDDDDAMQRLRGMADAFLVGGRPIARRVDDSVVRDGPFGQVVLRRGRGLAPASVAAFRVPGAILAVGGDLKNSITLVVGGQAYVSQHVGDLAYAAARRTFEDTVHDLLAMYAVAAGDLTVVHDRHPEYASTSLAAGLGSRRTIAVQHHRAHIASVLAERGAFDREVVGVAFDGTGFGDDGSIWGGELFAGSVRAGFTRVGHLHPAVLPGGDAAARHPVQAAAGFLAAIDAGDLTAPPFDFPVRYDAARAIVRSGVRTFPTTSAGRLFDAAAAVCGFIRPITFEGQAAMWLEHVARQASPQDAAALNCPATATEIDWRELLAGMIAARRAGVAPSAVARGFHRALARGLSALCGTLAAAGGTDTLVLSGGVMQNHLLLEEIRDALAPSGLRVWINHAVPANDGGLSLGQAALAAFAQDGPS